MVEELPAGRCVVGEFLWLGCKAEKGMLGGEMAVSVETENGIVSLFVAEERVREQRGGRAIPVRLIDENDVFRLVELPQPPIDGAGSRVVKVKRAQVSA